MTKQERYDKLLEVRDQLQAEIDKLTSWTVKNKFGTPTTHPLFDMLLKINRQLLQYEKEVTGKKDTDLDPFEEI